MTGVMMTTKRMNGKMNKKIVLFGTDNSGKTTLGKSLAKDLDGYYLPPLGPVPLKTQLAFLDMNLEEADTLIFDRFPVLEEDVCGVIFRGRSNFAQVPQEQYDRYIDSVDLFVFCNPGLEAILNWGEREQMDGVKDEIISLYAGYSEWFKLLKDAGKKVVEYNWRVSEDYLRILEEVSK